MKTDYPTRAVMMRAGGATRACLTEVSYEKARFMWDGWDWNEPAGGTGTVRDVCASGCTYSDVQSAVDAAVFGDVIEMAAETFGGPDTRTVVEIPDKTDFNGQCEDYTILRNHYQQRFGRRPYHHQCLKHLSRWQA
jgi:hypothetical protein